MVTGHFNDFLQSLPMNTSVLHESDFWLESLGFRQEMTLTVTSIKQVEHIIEVEFWNLQVFKIFKYFTSTVFLLYG